MALKNAPSNRIVPDPPGLFVLGWRSRRRTEPSHCSTHNAAGSLPDPYIYTLRHKVVELSGTTEDLHSRSLLE